MQEPTLHSLDPWLRHQNFERAGRIRSVQHGFVGGRFALGLHQALELQKRATDAPGAITIAKQTHYTAVISPPPLRIRVTALELIRDRRKHSHEH
jgi:hypothetical protein